MRVRGYQHVAPRLQLGQHALHPERHCALHRVMQALAVRQGIPRQVCVRWIVSRMEWISGIERRWSSTKAVAPHFHLLAPVLLHRLLLALPLQFTIMPLVEAEVAVALDLSTLAGHVEDDVECLLRTHQRRSEGHIKGQPAFNQQTSSCGCLFSSNWS